jgi:hypothetical protein
VLLRGYGGLCLTRPGTGTGPVTMETCTGAGTQLWRVEQGSASGLVRFRAETAFVCLAASGTSGASVVAEVCDGGFRTYLPVVIRSSRRVTALDGTVLDVAPQSAANVQDFVLEEGGQVRLLGRAGTPQYCFDVQDVYDSDFTSGLGGPAPGQRVQSFACLDSQLNQRWNVTGEIRSLDMCLTLDGGAVHRGAGAKVYDCDGRAAQEWDYYW